MSLKTAKRIKDSLRKDEDLNFHFTSENTLGFKYNKEAANFMCIYISSDIKYKKKN